MEYKKKKFRFVFLFIVIALISIVIAIPQIKKQIILHDLRTQLYDCGNSYVHNIDYYLLSYNDQQLFIDIFSRNKASYGILLGCGNCREIHIGKKDIHFILGGGLIPINASVIYYKIDNKDYNTLENLYETIPARN